MEQKQPLSKLSAALNKEADILSSEDVSATDEIVQALKDCIESIYPNSNWWEVCNFDMDGFAARDGITVQDIIEAIIAHIKPEFIAEESKVEESVHGEASITMDQFNPEQLVQHYKEEEEASSVTIDMKDDLETKYLVTVKPLGIVYGMVDKPHSILIIIDKEAFPEGVDMDTPEAYDKEEERVFLRSVKTFDEVIAFLNEWKASMMPKKESTAESTVNEDSPLPFEDKIDQVKDIVNKWAREGFNEKKHPFMDMDEFKRMVDKYHEKRPFKGVFHQAQADVYWDKKNKHWTMSFDFGSASKNKGLTELNKRLQSLGIKATTENAEWDDGNDMVDFEQATDKAPVEEAMPSNVGWGLKAWMLNEIISHMNNEKAYSGGWLYIWPDGSTKQDAIDYFGTPEDYKELEDSFKSYYKAYHKDGMYFGLDKSLTEADINKIMAAAHAWDKKLGLSPIADVEKEKSLKYDDDMEKELVEFIENLGIDEKDFEIHEETDQDGGTDDKPYKTIYFNKDDDAKKVYKALKSSNKYKTVKIIDGRYFGGGELNSDLQVLVSNFTYDDDTKEESIKEDTEKQDGKWVNKGKEGTHGKFSTKSKADAQRKAMFANGFKEDLEDEAPDRIGSIKVKDIDTYDKAVDYFKTHPEYKADGFFEFRYDDGDVVNTTNIRLKDNKDRITRLEWDKKTNRITNQHSQTKVDGEEFDDYAYWDNEKYKDDDGIDEDIGPLEDLIVEGKLKQNGKWVNKGDEGGEQPHLKENKLTETKSFVKTFKRINEKDLGDLVNSLTPKSKRLSFYYTLKKDDDSNDFVLALGVVANVGNGFYADDMTERDDITAINKIEGWAEDVEEETSKLNVLPSLSEYIKGIGSDGWYDGMEIPNDGEPGDFELRITIDGGDIEGGSSPDNPEK